MTPEFRAEQIGRDSKQAATILRSNSHTKPHKIVQIVQFLSLFRKTLGQGCKKTSFHGFYRVLMKNVTEWAMQNLGCDIGASLPQYRGHSPTD